MLSVIVDARAEARKLPSLLAQLTAGVVEGLVREVLVVSEASEQIAGLCEETGAERADSLAAAGSAARSELLLVLPAGLRLRDGWIPSLADHLAGGARAALVRGLSDGVFRRPYGLLVERRQVVGAQGADLNGLRRQLGLRPAKAG